MKTNWYLIYFTVQEVASLQIQKSLWNEALEYLKRTNDVDGWRVMLYGC